MGRNYFLSETTLIYMRVDNENHCVASPEMFRFFDCMTLGSGKLALEIKNVCFIFFDKSVRYKSMAGAF